MTDNTYLAVAYIGMIIALGIWTWTIMSRSKNLENKLEALESAISSKDDTNTDLTPKDEAK